MGYARALFLGLALSLSLRAQFSGRLTGSVVDTTGAAVPGATVQLFLPGGAKPLLSAKTADDGQYHLIGVRPAYYDLTVEAKGFLKATLRGLTVDPARETSVATVKLELPALTQSVDVTVDLQTVEIGNAEVSGTITMEQVRKLPVVDRDPLGLIQTQPGVVSNGSSYTVINGQRTSYANVTLDGINIQDNYIRDNALDYSPNRLLLGQVRQVTLVTSNANSAASGGSAQVAFSTPSGTNELHGEAYWQNRNSYFSANDWFNNQGGVARPFLNQNQLGGSLGGPIRKDKLFFYGNYEAIRARQQAPQTQTILTSDARNGIFTYRNASGAVQKVNLLALRNISIDPAIRGLLDQVPGADRINNFTVGDSSADALRNTAGYRFNARSNQTRDNVTAKVDYTLSLKHAFAGSYLWNRDNSDRPDYGNDFAAIPKITNPNHNHLVSTSWRWTPSARLTNELRGGFNLSAGDFLTSQQFGSYILTNLVFTNPVDEFLPQGRNTNTYVLSDNAAYQRGRHFVQFGVQVHQIRVRAYDDYGTIPTYYLDMGDGQRGLVTRDLPGVSSTDLTTANSLLASLGGYLDYYSQTFNVTSRSSGFVPGATNLKHLGMGEYALFVQDNWKLRPRVTVTLGMRYQIPRVADERDSLELTPVVQGSLAQTLLSDSTLDFAGGSAGRPWYRRSTRNFAPSAGLAWDVFGNGRTAFRAAYSISYVNDQALLAPQSALELNNGLIFTAEDFGLSGRAGTGVPKIATPAFQVPRKVSDNYADNPANTVGLIDPGLRTPYVQQWSFGIQQEVRHTIIEARYVGNHGVGGYRAFDYNQVVIGPNGFLDDFLRARKNALLAQAATGVFNPAYNAAIPGSQPLTVFPRLAGGGRLTNSTNRNYILRGQAGEMASNYQVNGANGSVNFFQNPNALGTDLLTNYSNSSYHSLQLEARHRARAGLDFQANYTFSKVLSDADGDVQSRLEQFLDVANTKIERARANFDLTHMIKGTAIYDLPFGKGHAMSCRALDRIIGGWSLGGIAIWQSGAPFTIRSGRGTLNREGGSRSYYNNAVTLLTKSQLDDVVQFRMTGNGPYIVSQAAINPNSGAGVNADGEAPFSGQVFFNPAAGTIGTLQKRMFSGPWTFNLDVSLQKSIHFTERHLVELRMEGLNILNHATFWSANQNINLQSFGTIGSMFYQPRVMQFGLFYRF